MSKYGAKKTVIDGIKFDSKMEGDYYLYIKKQKEDGKIKDFSLLASITSIYLQVVPLLPKAVETFRM